MTVITNKEVNIDKALKIKGFMSENELTWLARKAQESKCIIEIGNYYGRSTRALADNTEGIVYCIDPYPGQVLNTFGRIALAAGDYVRGKFLEEFDKEINEGKVRPFRGTFSEFDMVDTEPDFIFIDGNHFESFIKEDIECSLSLKKDKKLLISGHDYEHIDWPAVAPVVRSYFPSHEVFESIWWVYV